MQGQINIGLCFSDRGFSASRHGDLLLAKQTDSQDIQDVRTEAKQCSHKADPAEHEEKIEGCLHLPRRDGVGLPSESDVRHHPCESQREQEANHQDDY